MSRAKALMSWSSGKDSAWALQSVHESQEFDVVGLLTTVNETHKRVAMHAVRRELLRKQAEVLKLPLFEVSIPSPCSNQVYEEQMQKEVERAVAAEVSVMIFGDLFLEDIRKYREEKLAGTGITPVFPLWGIPTDELAVQMIEGGLRAHLTCVDPKQLSADFVGRAFDESLLRELPEGVDPCGENGEFHTFVHELPMMTQPLRVQVGEVLEREGFYFCDLLAAES